MSYRQSIHSIRRRISLSLMCALLCLLATACFRDASEVIDSQPVAREVASPTAVDTEVPEPTLTPELLEELFTEEPPDTFALTATALISRLTQAAELEATALLLDNTAESDTTSVLDDAPDVQARPISLVRVTVPPGEDCIHEIRAGETLFMLSLAYGSTVDEIAAASDINNPDRISVGQRITIPGCGTAGFAPPPTSPPPPTSDPSAIEAPAASEEVEITEAEDEEDFSALVQQAQNAILSNAQAGAADDFSAQSAIAPPRSYTVQQNDTLLGIALQFDTTIEALASLNNIADVNNVQAGDELLLP
ncbi:MAG: LysM peptidoglycan-binding domain-containing protein [Chloroflexota bacterium]|nr:LysM peptidoglycan-binding domain-containing protein [Chloroflexota bacterium]